VDTDIEYLTSRDKDVLVGLSNGMTRDEIAKSLGITRSNLRSVFGRLRCKTHLPKLKILYLSPREVEVLHCLCGGMIRAEISEFLGITRSTLRGVLGRLRCKTHYSKLEEVLLCLDEDFMNNEIQGRTNELGISLYDTWAHQIDWCEDVRRDPSNIVCLQVRCSNCNEWFTPKASAVGARILALNKHGGCRFYCSEECKHSCPIFNQNTWPKGFRKEHSNRDSIYQTWAKMIKERDNYECQICGETEGINAHHYEGLHVNDMQSLDLDMGVTLCEECHHRAHTGNGCTYYDLQERNICGRS